VRLVEANAGILLTEITVKGDVPSCPEKTTMGRDSKMHGDRILAGKIQDIPMLTLRYVHPRGEMEHLNISK